MIDEAVWGLRDAKGSWAPFRRCGFGPLFAWPTRPVAIARWFVRSYLLSWQLLYFAVASAAWFGLTPSLATMERFRPGWIGLLLVRNLAVVVVWYGAWHFWLYVRRRQDTRTKYNGSWPRGSNRFTLGHQNRDNMLWSLLSGVPLVTAFEVVTMWLFANGHIPYVHFEDHPYWFVGWMLLIPIWREVHFYFVHRLIHCPVLYQRVHALHHRNTNPGPWSGLSMHPVEHLLYFSAIVIHWVVPSHPVHALFTQMHLVMAPVPGHSGFDKVELFGNATADTNAYAHFLHHKFFEVNYSDGAVPLDRWFGSFHDGSEEAAAAMRARRVPQLATSD